MCLVSCKPFWAPTIALDLWYRHPPLQLCRTHKALVVLRLNACLPCRKARVQQSHPYPLLLHVRLLYLRLPLLLPWLPLPLLLPQMPLPRLLRQLLLPLLLPARLRQNWTDSALRWPLSRRGWTQLD